MEPAKTFNNVILGQFVLTGVPVKVYVAGRFLTITSADDVEDVLMGFGMDEDGVMHRFDYTDVEKLLVRGNEVTLDTYNQGMEDKFAGNGESNGKEDEEGEDDKKSDKLPKENINMKLGSLLKEITKDEQSAEIDAAKAEIQAAKLKKKASDQAVKDAMKKAKDKITLAKKQEIEEAHDGYTFGTGDIVKNINPECPHHGSQGIINKVMDLPDMAGKVAIYTVTNNGDTYKPGDKLTKTVDQLEKI